MKYFAISNKLYDMKTTLILNREYKVTISEKPFRLPNHKIESDIEFSGRRDQVTAAFLLAKQ